MEKIKSPIYLFALLFIAMSCGSPNNDKLPYIGRFEIIKNEETNKIDTLFHKVGDFKFVDQDSQWVTPETFKNKIYITDFFFTSCPDICPIMKTQMIRIYEKYEDNDQILLLSHTIDPKHDSVSVLKDYADRLDVNASKWMFVTGSKDDIYKTGQTSYMASIADNGQNGLIHSGRFFLIDKDKHIRGAYDGTDENEVSILLNDIDKLLKEQGNEGK